MGSKNSGNATSSSSLPAANIETPGVGIAPNTDAVETWNVVKGKKPNSPKVNIIKSASPQAGATILQDNTNRFLSLSNLEGDSNASGEELASTTALVLEERVGDGVRTVSGLTVPQKDFSSIHQLDKLLLPKLASSSAGMKIPPVSTRIVIKEKGNKS